MALSFPLGPPLGFNNGDGWWPLAWICLSPLMLVATRSGCPLTAALHGLIAGVTAFGFLISWIDPFLIRWAKLTAPEAGAISLLLVLYVAVYFGVFSLALCNVRRRWGACGAFLLAPAIWTGLEWLRSVLFTGFPWSLLGYSQMPALVAIQVADLTGVFGVSFLVVTGNSLAALMLARLLPERAEGPGRSAQTGQQRHVSMVLSVILLSGLGYGVWRLSQPVPGNGDLHAALVQANVAQSEKWDPKESLRIETDHVAMTREAARHGARLVVWSESSVPISITRNPDYERRLADLSLQTGADLVVGTVAYEARDGIQTPFNSAVLVRPGIGVSDRYDKIHLVPFGEYVPLKKLLFFLESLVNEASDFEPGDQIRLLRGEGSALAPLICYEAIFPDLVRRFTKAGAGILVNITNDAWYGDTAMPRQHLAQAAMRAVENRRYLLRCASTGISAFVEPTGRIAMRSRLGEKIVLESTVRSSSEITWYTATGDVLPILCVILTLAALLTARRAAIPRGSDVR